MSKVLRVLLWILTGAYAFLGVLALTGALDGPGADAAGRGLSVAFGVVILIFAAVAALILFLGRNSAIGLTISAIVLSTPIAVFGIFYIGSARSEAQARAERDELHAGKTDFGDQPALFAVATAIARNDQEGIRSAAKALPNLQTPASTGKTLLYFAVSESWQRPELVAAVKTLLEAGADPNFTTEHPESYAMAASIHGSALLLRTMLDAGGNPNAPDPQGRAMIFGNWYLAYFEAEQGARFQLLLDRGADINATIPETESHQPGYTIAMVRASLGRGDKQGYTDALNLLDRGADFTRAATDGMTLAKILEDHRAYYSPSIGPPPPEFERLWQWLAARGALPPAP